MIYKLWRQAHLWLAALSFACLVWVGITGAILGVYYAGERFSPHIVDGADTLKLSSVIANIQQSYTEPTKLTRESNGIIVLNGISEEGDEFAYAINPHSGRILGKVEALPAFIQSVTTLHRSLFMHEWGRWLVGIATFLLLLILISGAALIIGRFGWRYFCRMPNRNDSGYWHLVLGRWLLLPILASSATGTYLFAQRFWHAPSTPVEAISPYTTSSQVFDAHTLGEVHSLDLPLLAYGEHEYTLRLADREYIMDAEKQTVKSLRIYPTNKIWGAIALDLHTGRTNAFLAIVLSLGSLSLIFFVWSGFSITLRRWRMRRSIEGVSNPSTEADISLLVGSAGGSTLRIAEGFALQLRSSGLSVSLAMLGQYKSENLAPVVLILTCTYGDGIAPENSADFVRLLELDPPTKPFRFTVLAFGSRKFRHFCAYGITLDQHLSSLPQAESIMPLTSINNRSAEELKAWAKAWSELMPQAPLSYGADAPTSA